MEQNLIKIFLSDEIHFYSTKYISFAKKNLGLLNFHSIKMFLFDKKYLHLSGKSHGKLRPDR